jgi:hypothetical protein
MRGWDVWGELRRRRHLVLEFDELDPGERGRIDDMPNGYRQITLDTRLTQRERRASLCHELIHDERGILFPACTPLAVIAKEEARVRDATAERLVPLDLLDDFVRWRVIDFGRVHWRDVADEFEVPEYVARRAMEILEQRVRRRHPSAG